MKAVSLTLSFSIALVISSCSLFHDNSVDAVSYNDSIINEQSKIVMNIIAMSDNMSTDLSKAEQKRLDGLKQAELSIKKIEDLGAYKGDNSLKEAASQLFGFYKESLNTNFKEIISLCQKDSIFDADKLRMNTIDSVFYTEQRRMDSLFELAQESFAKKNGFAIKENEIQKEIDKVNDQTKRL